jgi:F0F1-type ATP synthase gamma subunit
MPFLISSFVNTMTQKPIVEKLIPVVAAELEDDAEDHFGPYFKQQQHLQQSLKFLA